jgi:hypothetical protein
MKYLFLTSFLFLFFYLCIKPSENHDELKKENYRILHLKITPNKVGPFRISKVKTIQNIYEIIKINQEYDVLSSSKTKIILSRYGFRTLIFFTKKSGRIYEISCVDKCKYGKLRIGQSVKKILKIKGVKEITKKKKKKKKKRQIFKKKSIIFYARNNFLTSINIIR